MAGCIFCKIASGEVSAKIVHQNDHVVVFRDLNPQAPVHVLVIPKKHIENLSSSEETDLSMMREIFSAILKVTKDEKLSADGFRVVANDGKNGGQTVNHLHFHVLGGRPMSWPPG